MSSLSEVAKKSFQDNNVPFRSSGIDVTNMEKVGSGGFATVYRESELAHRVMEFDRLLEQTKGNYGIAKNVIQRIARNIAFLTDKTPPHVLIPRVVYVTPQSITTTQDFLERNAEEHIKQAFEHEFGIPWRNYFGTVEDRDHFGNLVFGEILLPALRGLQELHANGIINRDFKFGNILTHGKLRRPERVEISDLDTFSIPSTTDESLTSILDPLGVSLSTLELLPDGAYVDLGNVGTYGPVLDTVTIAKDMLRVMGFSLRGGEGNVHTRLQQRNEWRSAPLGEHFARAFGQKYRGVAELIWRATDYKHRFESAKAFADDLERIVGGKNHRTGQRRIYASVRRRHKTFRNPLATKLTPKHAAVGALVLGAVALTAGSVEYSLYTNSLQYLAGQVVEGQYDSASLEPFIRRAHAVLLRDMDEEILSPVKIETAKKVFLSRQNSEGTIYAGGTTVGSGHFLNLIYDISVLIDKVGERQLGLDLLEKVSLFAAHQRLTFADTYEDLKRPHNLGRFKTGLALENDSRVELLSEEAQDRIRTNVRNTHLAGQMILSRYDSLTGTFTRNETPWTSVWLEYFLKPFLCELASSPSFSDVLAGDPTVFLDDSDNDLLRRQLAAVDWVSYTRQDFVHMMEKSSLTSLRYLTVEHNHDQHHVRKVAFNSILRNDGLERSLLYDNEPGYRMGDDILSEKTQRLAGTIYSLAKTLATFGNEFSVEGRREIIKGVEELLGEYIFHVNSETFVPEERWHINGEPSMEHLQPDYTSARYIALALQQGVQFNTTPYGISFEELQRRTLDVVFNSPHFEINSYSLSRKVPTLFSTGSSGEQSSFWGLTTQSESIFAELSVLLYGKTQ